MPWKFSISNMPFCVKKNVSKNALKVKNYDLKTYSEENFSKYSKFEVISHFSSDGLHTSLNILNTKLNATGTIFIIQSSITSDTFQQLRP